MLQDGNGYCQKVLSKVESLIGLIRGKQRYEVTWNHVFADTAIFLGYYGISSPGVLVSRIENYWCTITHLDHSNRLLTVVDGA
jgi:hypothetical protein